MQMRADKLFRFSIISADFGHCLAALLGSHKVSHDDYCFHFSQRRRSIICLFSLIPALFAKRKARYVTKALRCSSNAWKSGAKRWGSTIVVPSSLAKFDDWNSGMSPFFKIPETTSL